MLVFGGKSNGYHGDLYGYSFQNKTWSTYSQIGRAPSARYGHVSSFYKVFIRVV